MLFYRLLITLLWLPVSMALLARVIAGREGFSDWLERVGLRNLSSGEPRLWLHAASNGELASARPVIFALRDADPALKLLVTTNSLSGRDMARDWDIPGVIAQLAPLDMRWSAARIIRRCRVRGLIIIESEFWPNRIAALSKRGLPVFVLGARLSRRSAQTWRRLAPLARELQARITYLSPQDEGSRRRFLSLGARTEQMGPVLNLKAFYAPPKDMLPDESLRNVFQPEDTWLAASTHPGEDKIVLDAHKRLQSDWPGLHLIIAPRHPARGGEIGSLARRMGFNVALRSEGDRPRRNAVYIADTLREMPLWYQCAGICFVGGSLAEKGGHTPFEPAVFSSAILHGPDVRNFTAIYRKLDVAGAAIQVEDAPSLRNAVLQLRDTDRREAMQRIAHDVLDQPAHLDTIIRELVRSLKPR
ncbi:3-deoxy-D-manno-octulosonic acid transferase [Primorskyibacter aestuariivivens]|uniref:3-deoxy-D-manno-octulosonic acid transferase n=1 Tax=Primorskyibacter aestuariivivens TaxID=1888912 RepID=UPI002301C30B|nr:glycosyltransferase N-terminal domain-containing protein [Primorskyibacter aestuariivivens]MDA7428499.1 3-deoxy-D-manno-octulosonic acid transferase [Primorskyibacter aestuariivivens]